ncbi:MAG: lysophospholipid acyltransferase family protein [Candidatus Electryoneaceae bacterium]|nr:lysophospholipid acyltransferase family protein [Candidatus Electryoneaceae bacterium]
MSQDNTRQPRKIRFFYRLSQLVTTTLFRLLYGLRVEGRENVPKTGAFILASNHQSFFDPPIIGACCPREIFFAAKKELFEIPILKHFVKYHNSIPVRRTGSDKEMLVTLMKRLKEGNGMIIFPEGTRYSDGKLHPPKAGIGLFALRSRAAIIPTYVSGSANLGRQFWRRKLRLRFGKPLILEEHGLENAKGREGYQAIAWTVATAIAEVGGIEPPMKQ